MPADVVGPVQGALVVAGEHDRLAHDVDDRHPAGLVEAEVGAAAHAEPLAVQDPVALDGGNTSGSTYISRGSAACSPPGPSADTIDVPVAHRHQVAGAVVALARRQHRQRGAATGIVHTGGGRLRPRRARDSAGGTGSRPGSGSGPAPPPSRTTGSIRSISGTTDSSARV